MCELTKGGMLKVENAEISIEQKLNQAWNCSNIKVKYKASILQLKARVYTQNEGTRAIFKIKERKKTNFATTGHE